MQKLVCTGCIPHFVVSGGVRVGVPTGLAGLVPEPEIVEGGGVTQVVGTELQDRFAGGLKPEFLASLDPAVDLLDRRFDMAASPNFFQVIKPKLL